ncbi:MAG: adenylate/guanylate cyclase domain-containing protein [Candidatus Kapaibacteriota bacterium]
MNDHILEAEVTITKYIRTFQYQVAEEFITSFLQSVNWKDVELDIYCTFLLYQYEAYYKQSYYSKSSQVARKLEQLLNDNEQVLSETNIAKIYLAIGQTQIISMNLEDAELSLSKAKDNSTYESDCIFRANILYAQGNVLKIKGEYKQAQSKYTDALNELNGTSEFTLLANGYVFLGMLYFDQSYFDLAFSMYVKAQALYEMDSNFYGKSAVFINLGNIYRRLSDNQKALEYYQKSLELNQGLDRKSGIANVYASMGNIYFHLNDFEKAALYYRNSIEMYEVLGNKSALYSIYNNVGSTYLMNNQYDLAIEYYNMAFERYRNTGNYTEELYYYVNMGHLFLKQENFTLAKEYNEKGLKLSRKMEDEYRIHEFLSSLGIINFYESMPDGDTKESISLVEEAYAFTLQANLKYEQATHAKRLSDMYSMIKDWQAAFTYHKIYHDLEAEIHSSDIKKHAEILEHNRKILEAEHQQQSELTALREHSKLLYDILPATIAERIIAGEKTIAEETASVSIFFSDIVGFTSIAESIAPSALVQNLNTLFSIIDNLADKHGIEKIKTIGDSYMAVCGIPEHKHDHAIRMAEFAKEVMTLSESFNFEDRRIQLRIGVHSGPAVAGVIGLNRYTYDLWGDSVNIASRLESTGMPGKIQVSESFVTELSNQSNGKYITSYRGETEMKGKGLMRTYTLL